MLLMIVILILAVVFLATRYGVKSSSKSLRILSYAAVFLSVGLMVYLLTVYLTEKLAGNLPIF